ncbi:hypothetical protein QJS66_20960 [Kocuria rhizophila]|nr:hypothetical protein QJS66_20960 [Kocuria rhizophila]
MRGMTPCAPPRAHRDVHPPQGHRAAAAAARAEDMYRVLEVLFRRPTSERARHPWTTPGPRPIALVASLARRLRAARATVTPATRTPWTWRRTRMPESLSAGAVLHRGTLTLPSGSPWPCSRTAPTAARALSVRERFQADPQHLERRWRLREPVVRGVFADPQTVAGLVALWSSRVAWPGQLPPRRRALGRGAQDRVAEPRVAGGAGRAGA